MELSLDQRQCLSKLEAFLNMSGLQLKGSENPKVKTVNSDGNLLAVLGYAGSGKTELLRILVKLLEKGGVDSANIESETKLKEGRRCYAILAPTNKAVSVLKMLELQATTLHRVLYSPLYDPNYEKISDWLQGIASKPSLAAFSVEKLDSMKSFF